MKKIVSLLVVLLMCLTTGAIAESVPSKTTGDLTQFEVAFANMPADTGFFILPDAQDEAEYQNRLDICQKEVITLSQAKSITEYFGEVKDASGAVVNMAAQLGSDTLNVYEFCALSAGGYEEANGAVTAKMLFSTPYEVGEKVLVMVGIVTVNQNGAQSVEWFVYEGVGAEEQGCIRVELNPEIVLAIQNGTALLAIVSK